jgi:GT2 family glycosyltransferase
MRVGYFIPTFNQLDWVRTNHLPSLNTDGIEFVYVHSNRPEKSLKLEVPMNVPVFYSYSETNLGVAKSWNFFCELAVDEGLDAVIIANDDIILFEDTISTMLDKLKEFPRDFIAYGGDNSFSLFTLPLSVFKLVGKFDENFHPAYFEDNDYFMRMKLNNVQMQFLGDPKYYHEGSSTIKSLSAEDLELHHRVFRINQAYYIEKWGGLPGYETVTQLT